MEEVLRHKAHIAFDPVIQHKLARNGGLILSSSPPPLPPLPAYRRAIGDRHVSRGGRASPRSSSLVSQWMALPFLVLSSGPYTTI